MTWEYIGATIRELTLLFLFFWCAHALVEYSTGVSIIERAAHDFQEVPVPQWTWPTWLVLAIAMFILAIEILYRVSLYAKRRVGP